MEPIIVSETLTYSDGGVTVISFVPIVDESIPEEVPVIDEAPKPKRTYKKKITK